MGKLDVIKKGTKGKAMFKFSFAKSGKKSEQKKK
jgi:hypothetical protein